MSERFVSERWWKMDMVKQSDRLCQICTVVKTGSYRIIEWEVLTAGVHREEGGRYISR